MCVNENIRVLLSWANRSLQSEEREREREHLLESGGRPRLSNYHTVHSSISRRSDSLSLSAMNVFESFDRMGSIFQRRVYWVWP